MSKSKFKLNLTMAGALMALASPAAAQDAPSDNSGVDEIIITAQRFSESAQRASVSLEVFGAEDLQGVSDVRQLATLTPGVNLSPAGNVIQTYVRGVGSGNATNQQEAAVSYNFDGVFLSTTTMISPMMYDLQRVEVLKGPQGTLYGRNSSGGAINLLSTGANTEALEGYLEGEVGDYSLRRVTGAINLPLSDTFAVRLAGQDVAHDGYLSDGQDDQDMSAFRVRALWTPSNTVTVNFGADVAEIDSSGAGSSISPTGFFVPGTETTPGGPACFLPAAACVAGPGNPTNDDFVGALDPRLAGTQAGLQVIGDYAPPHFDSDQAAVYAQVDWDLGFATLTVLPAVRYEELSSLSYVPGYGYGEDNDTEQRTFEARLANQTDSLRWVIGGYYYNNDQKVRTELDDEIFPLNENIVFFDANLESFAFFGEATLSLTDAFRVIGGVRYTEEESSMVGTINDISVNPAYDPAVDVNLDYAIDRAYSDDAITWRGGLEYDVAPDSMLFFTVSRGFKAGGNYNDIPSVDASFQPEFLTAYTLGSRNRFLDGTLQVNAEVFYWEIEDQQVPYVGLNSIGSVGFITANAGQGTMHGANIDVVWRATHNDTFRFAVENLTAEFDEFNRTMIRATTQSNSACEITPVTPPATGAPFELVNFDCGGLPMPKAPEWSGSAGYEHVFNLTGGGDIAWDINATFASERYTYVTFTPETFDDEYALVNSSLTYTAPDAAWSLSGWVRNATEERVVASGSQIGTAIGRDLLMAPRTYGVTLRRNF